MLNVAAAVTRALIELEAGRKLAERGGAAQVKYGYARVSTDDQTPCPATRRAEKGRMQNCFQE
jgi:hypothetical protein